jgi:glycosyltransferase involved in cell wall biosynthesis
MADCPLVSVVVPTYNRPDFLKKTVQSIAEQTYKNIEIIIVSNGFNKNNQKVAQEFNDSRIIYADQENSGGPASPRNHGIKIAKGKYVAFCDDDDLWMPDKIEKQIKALEENLEYGLCYSKMLRFDGQKEWANPGEEGPASLQSLLYINTVPISSVFMRKSLIDKFGGFSESNKVGSSEDYEFLLRHAAETNFYFLDEYLIKYWCGDNRVTQNSPSVAYIINYSCQIFWCYSTLRKSRKIRLHELIGPSFYMLFSNLKIFIHQLSTKLRLRK